MAAWEIVFYKYNNMGGSEDGVLVSPQQRERVYIYADPNKNLLEVTKAALEKMEKEGLFFRSITFRRTIDVPAALPVAPALPNMYVAEVFGKLMQSIKNPQLGSGQVFPALGVGEPQKEDEK